MKSIDRQVEELLSSPEETLPVGQVAVMLIEAFSLGYVTTLKAAYRASEALGDAVSMPEIEAFCHTVATPEEREQLGQFAASLLLGRGDGDGS